MANQPVLLIRLTGEENVSVINESVSWTPKDKYEASYVMKTGDTAKTIDYSGVETVRTMIFIGTGAFKVAITASGSTVTHETQDVFILSPSAAFRAAITAIAISTLSATDITIQVRIYGEE